MIEPQRTQRTQRKRSENLAQTHQETV